MKVGTSIAAAADFPFLATTNKPSIKLDVKVIEEDDVANDTGTGTTLFAVDLTSTTKQTTTLTIPVSEVFSGRAIFKATFDLVPPTLFVLLWNDYPDSDPVPRDTFSNQCAIKVTAAIQASEPNLMSTFRGRTTVSEYAKWGSKHRQKQGKSAFSKRRAHIGPMSTD